MIEPFVDGQVRTDAPGPEGHLLRGELLRLRHAGGARVQDLHQRAVGDGGPKELRRRELRGVRGRCLHRAAQQLRPGAVGRVLPDSPQRAHHLRGQEHLRPLRHHHQRHAVRAGVGGARHPRDQQHHPLPAKIYANEGICQVLFFEADDDDVCETSYADKNIKRRAGSPCRVSRAPSPPIGSCTMLVASFALVWAADPSRSTHRRDPQQWELVSRYAGSYQAVASLRMLWPQALRAITPDSTGPLMFPVTEDLGSWTSTSARVHLPVKEVRPADFYVSISLEGQEGGRPSAYVVRTNKSEFKEPGPQPWRPGPTPRPSRSSASTISARRWT